MSDFRKGLCDRMIKLYGFENPIVIQFCRLAEIDSGNFGDEMLKLLVESHEADPQI